MENSEATVEENCCCGCVWHRKQSMVPPAMCLLVLSNGQKVKVGKRFVKLLLAGAVLCIAELNMKYSKSCLILDVVVQIEKDTSIAFHVFTSSGW